MKLSKAELQNIIDAWQAAGLETEPIEPISAALQRRYEVAQEAQELEADTKAIGRQLADGDISFADAVAMSMVQSAAKESVPGQSTPRAHVLLTSARKALEGDANRYLINKGESLFFDYLEPQFVALKNDATPMALNLEGFNTADEASRGGVAAASYWSQLQALDEQRAGLVKIAKMLYQYELVPSINEDLLQAMGRSFTRLIPQPLDAA